MSDLRWSDEARGRDPEDECPLCHVRGCYFASDFKKLGKHQIRVCSNCSSVSENGKRIGDFVLYPEE